MANSKTEHPIPLFYNAAITNIDCNPVHEVRKQDDKSYRNSKTDTW